MEAINVSRRLRECLNFEVKINQLIIKKEEMFWLF